MKVALVCDDLVQHGGHEKVILDVCRIFPEAPLYTTLATQKWQEVCRQEGIELKTSFLQKFPFKEKLNRVYAPFLLYILALESFTFDEYDLVVSLSSRFAHGIITKPQTIHICYMSTIGRMFWEPDVYFKNESFGELRILKRLADGFLRAPLSYVRLWDKVASHRVDWFLANSETTRRRIKKYYRREAEVIHPAINLRDFSDGSKVAHKDYYNNYYLVLTRLAPWKKVDIAIEACTKLGRRLIIVGSGPDRRRLKKIARGDENIEFLGYVSGSEKIKYIKNCCALINTQFEDFGLVPLEVMACGKPVIAFGRGGALETVEEGVTGEFFSEQTVDSLIGVLKDFSHGKYNKQDCIKQAEKFDIKNFNEKIFDFVDQVMG